MNVVDVIRPAEPGYDGLTTGYQLGWPHRPDRVLVPHDLDALDRVTKAASDEPFAVQRSGHGRREPLSGGTLVATHRLAHVTVDAQARTARVQAGATWADVVALAADHDLAPLSGSSPSVGVVGYLLGGGLGLLGRRHGWAGDHHRVTRWSGATIAEVEVDLFPVDTVVAGALVFDTDALPALLTGYAGWVAGLPSWLTSSVAVVPMPDAPGVPEPLRGRRIGQLRVVSTGDDDATREQVAALVDPLGDPLTGGLSTMPFADVATTVYRDPPDPHAYLGTNTQLTELAPDVVTALLDRAGSTVVQVNHLGGELTDSDEVLVRLLTPEMMLPATAARAVHEEVLAVARPWSTGHLEGFVFGPQSPDADGGA